MIYATCSTIFANISETVHFVLSKYIVSTHKTTPKQLKFWFMDTLAYQNYAYGNYSI